MNDENLLIKKAQNGDVGAFEKLIDTYQVVIYNIAYKIFGNEHDASDAAQEALIKVYKNLYSFNGKSKFSTWVYRIAYNTCLDEIRKKKKGIADYSIDEQYEDGNISKIEIVDTALTPEQSITKKERVESINNAINELSMEHRTAIILRDVHGYSYDEISQIQGCSLGTVKSRINRARKELKEKLIKMEQFELF